MQHLNNHSRQTTSTDTPQSRREETDRSTDPYSRTSVKVEQNISEMSKDKLESLVKHMEETLSEMEQLKLHCGKQSEELSQLVVELRRENQELVEKYNQLAAEMKEAKEIIEQLQDTKYAFNAKERQAQKLSRQLWRPTRRMKKPWACRWLLPGRRENLGPGGKQDWPRRMRKMDYCRICLNTGWAWRLNWAQLLSLTSKLGFLSLHVCTF